MYLNLLNCDSHALISLINETTSYEELIKKIQNTLETMCITEEDLNRKKKVLISNELFSFENIEVINDMIVDNIIFNGRVEENMIDLLNSLNIQEMNEVINTLSLKNYSIVILKK